MIRSQDGENNAGPKELGSQESTFIVLVTNETSLHVSCQNWINI